MRHLPVRETAVQEIAGRDIAGQEGRTELVKRIDVALHGLCQPLTVLQCRLAMGELIGDADAMRDAIREGLQECVRMNQTVGSMRAMLQQVMADTEGERIR